MLLVSIVAAAVAFLPFAFDTSPWDAVRLHVPGNQGNWWHFLAGAPFFLAFPMIWLRLRALFGARTLSSGGRLLLWPFIGLSVIGTLLVETPFLLHLAGTSQWQRFIVLGFGIGVILASGILLWVRYKRLSPAAACFIGLDTAWLANAALCLVVYAGAAGAFRSRSGWFVCVVICWPILPDLVRLFRQTAT